MLAAGTQRCTPTGRAPQPVQRAARRRRLAAAGGSGDGPQQPSGEPDQQRDQQGAPPPAPQQQQQRAQFSPLDPSQTVVYGGNLPSPRRLALGGLAATTVALVGNFGGLTSFLLSADGGRFAESTRADVLFPVRGSGGFSFKRCLDLANGYEFRYPRDWLADRTLAQRQAMRAEQQFALDMPSPSSRRRAQRDVAEPVAAFGPAGSTGEENVSVVVAPIRPGFQLRQMGDPAQLAATFLSTVAAPDGSGKSAELLRADERIKDGELYYEFEYTISSTRFNRHNVSVSAARNDLLFTFNAQCPEGARWEADGPVLRAAAESFRLLNSGAAQTGFPDRL